MRTHLVKGNPESFVGKHFVGWVRFQQGREVCGVMVKFQEWLSIHTLRKRMEGSLYFILIFKNYTYL